MNDISKLPKWAQSEIEKLSRQRDEAVKALNRFLDQQTPSGVAFDQMPGTGEEAGPSFKTGFIQTDRVAFNHAGVDLTVFLTRKNDGQREYGIELSWHSNTSVLSHVALIPKSYQQAMLVAKENMR